jgi:hypothetical protein
MNNTNKDIHPMISKYSPGKPPKKYNAKKAIGFFVCLYSTFGARCSEFLRVRISPEGDIYILPHPGQTNKSNNSKNREFHISHHTSGEFHWAIDGKSVHPVFGESDYPAAFGLVLKVRHPPCFCFRRGKNLDAGEISVLVDCLAKYIPFKINSEIACQNLINNNLAIFHSPDFSGFLKRRKFLEKFSPDWLTKWLKSRKS